MELTLVPKRYFRAMSPEGSGHKMREQTERIMKHMILVDGARSGSLGASLAAEAPLAESRGRPICGTSSRSNISRLRSGEEIRDPDVHPVWNRL
jgi:hypothetical protein